MANGTIIKEMANKINITGTVSDGIIIVDSEDIQGTPILAYDGGGWYWSISRNSGKWRFMGFSMSGTTISHPANEERTITVVYVPLF